MANEKRLIDADAFECVCVNGKSDDFCNGVLYVLDMIDAQPTVDAVEVVHGRWKRELVPIANMDIVRYRDTCSICGAKAEFLCRDSHYNYCPNCGAKMDGDGNG